MTHSYHASDNNQGVPPGLFSRIMRRLGLERQLQIVQRNLGWFSAGLISFSLLCIFAFIGLEHVLERSSFGPFLLLLFSNPGAVLRYWHSFMFSVAEAVPGAWLLFFLVPLLVVLILARFTSFAITKWSSLTNRIRSNRTNATHAHV